MVGARDLLAALSVAQFLAASSGVFDFCGSIVKATTFHGFFIWREDYVLLNTRWIHNFI